MRPVILLLWILLLVLVIQTGRGAERIQPPTQPPPPYTEIEEPR